MPRITRKLFADLAIWMLLIGLAMGAAFPFLMLVFGFARETTLTPTFFAATLTAGIGLAAITFSLVYAILHPRLRLLVEHMHTTEELIRKATESAQWEYCDPEHCMIPVDSDDDLGATALAFNQLVSELVRSRQLDHAASQFSTSLSSCLDLKELNQRGLDLFMQHTLAAAGAVFLETKGELQVAASHGLADLDAISHSPHLLMAMQSGEVQRIDLPKGIQVESVLTRFRPSEVLLIPVSFKNTPLACVVLATAHCFPPDTPWLIELVRQGYGLALNNALTHARLQHTAMIDPLTEVYNRGFGMTRLREEFSRSLRSEAPLGICMFDIDHFKKINDTYGHLVGDRVLVRVATAAKRMLREGDVLLRYGGEEFVVILPGVDMAGVREVGERLRQLVESIDLSKLGDGLAVTISLGCTSFPDDDVNADETLLAHADAALYRAKRNGRNRVYRFDDQDT